MKDGYHNSSTMTYELLGYDSILLFGGKISLTFDNKQDNVVPELNKFHTFP